MSSNEKELDTNELGFMQSSYNTFNKVIFELNTNKYLAGLAIISINLGSKYLGKELSPKQDEFIRNTIIRKLIIFVIFFTGTRDVIASLILTVLYVLLFRNLFNEESKYYILKK